ncbi:MAG: TonB-dependent receptor [Planctomycetia bacterium]
MPGLPSPSPRPARRVIRVLARAACLPALLLGLAAPAARADEAAPAPTPPPPAPARPLPPPPADLDVDTLPERLIAPPAGQPVRALGGRVAAQQVEPASVLDTPALDLLRAGSLGAMLAAQPGVSATAFAPGASRPVLRGLSGERIRVLEGGVGTLDVAGLSDDHAVPVDPFALRRVEVLRGPAALRYGPRAVGGVVWTDDGRVPEGALGRPLAVRAGAAAGSADDERSAFAQVQGQVQAWRWRVAAFTHDTGDLRIPGFAKSQALLDAEGNAGGAGEPRGVLPGSSAEAHGASVGGARLLAGGGVLGGALTWFETRYGLPQEEGVEIDLQRLRLDARGRHATPLRGWRELAWSAAFVDYEHVELEGGEEGTRFEQRAAELRAELVRCAGACREGSLGLQLSVHDLEVVGEEAVLPADRTVDAGLFALERWQAGSRLALEGALRVDLRSIQSVQDDTFLAGSASVGALWQAARSTTLGLGLSATQRAPTAYELYADGPHLATGTYEVGDASLGAEQALGVDLTLRHASRRLDLVATLHGERFPRFIALRDTGAADAGSGLPTYAYEAVEARLWGVEVEGAVHLLRCASGGLDLLLQADATRGDDLDRDAPLPRMPPVRLGGGLLWQDGRWTARLTCLRALEQDRLAPGERPSAAFTQLDAALAWRPGGSLRGLEAVLSGTNLLDEEIRLHTSFVKDRVPLAGASLRLTVQVDF